MEQDQYNYAVDNSLETSSNIENPKHANEQDYYK